MRCLPAPKRVGFEPKLPNADWDTSVPENMAYPLIVNFNWVHVHGRSDSGQEINATRLASHSMSSFRATLSSFVGRRRFRQRARSTHNGIQPTFCLKSGFSHAIKFFKSCVAKYAMQGIFRAIRRFSQGMPAAGTFDSTCVPALGFGSFVKSGYGRKLLTATISQRLEHVVHPEQFHASWILTLSGAHPDISTNPASARRQLPD